MRDDERYDEWLTPAGARAERKRRAAERRKTVKAVQTAVRPVVQEPLRRATERAVTAASAGAAAVRRGLATRLAVGAGSVATVGIGTAAAAAIVTGAAAYFGTRYLIARFGPEGRRLRREDQAFEAAHAFRLARQQVERQLGRPTTYEENQRLSVSFKAKLASIGWKGA